MSLIRLMNNGGALSDHPAKHPIAKERRHGNGVHLAFLRMMILIITGRQ